MGKIKRKTYKKKHSKRFKGGMPAFVGAPLNYNNFSTYPGLTTHGGNHYGLNSWNNDLYTGNIINERAFSIFPNKYTQGLRGGYIYNKSKMRYNKSKTSKRKTYGGLGPLLSDAVNGTQNIGNSVGNIYNTLAGLPSGPSPLPYEQKLSFNNI